MENSPVKNNPKRKPLWFLKFVLLETIGEFQFDVLKNGKMYLNT
jgi:hypothetical protein